MSNLVFAENVQYVSNGKKYGRTNGILNAGILTPTVKYSGIVGKVKLGETVVLGDLLYPKTAVTPSYMIADPTSGAIKGPANAIALEGGADTEYIDALFEGYLNVPAWITTEKLCAKARMLFTTSGIGVDEELITINGIVFALDIAANGVSGADVLLLPAGTSQAQWETSMTLAIVNAALIAQGDTDLRVETDWAGNDLAFAAINAGVAGNLIAISEGCTNGVWTGGAVVLAGGTDAGIVYAGDVGKTVDLANVPATGGDMVQVIGQALSPTELMFRPITDYDTV